MPTLHWIGKDKVINHHMDVPFKVLDHSYGFDNGTQTEEETKSGNKIIHGDNLEALKALLPEYEGKIKCIYIDPPYNTGNESWVYNDNVNEPKIKKWLGQVVGKEAEDLTRHDKWLCMMYPRLKLLQKLLAEEGSLVISIGYQEVFNLMPVLKELFASKQIACVTIQTSGGKPSGSFNYQHEFLIFIVPNDFEANPMNFTGGKERTPFEGLTLATFDKTQRPNQTYPIFVNIETSNLESVGESLQERIKSGKYQGELSEFDYDFLEAPEGTVAVWPITSKGKPCVWRLSPTRFLSDWQKGYIKISPNRQKGSLNRYSVQYLPEGVIKKIEKGILKVNGKDANSPTLTFGENKTVGSDIPTIWLEKEFYSVKGTTLLNDIFSKKIFNYPKPLPLITEILRAMTSQDDIILDSFAGSASTAHATLDLNTEDGGNRKYILVEMEDYAQTVTAERVKMVINGFSEQEGTGGSFDFYELGQPMFFEEGNLNELVGVEKIRQYVFYTETKTPLTETKHKDNKHFLGKNNDTAYYFNYEQEEVTTLDHAFLATMKTKAEQYVIYADNCLLTKDFIIKHHIIFKKIPRDITRF
ncbi:site-specific DNA-methyltransferase [Pedobacter sp. WC2501]|uniref:site-specific DNA-methyltransferase n=1 Tax=Pedobacter sp. WC2501 TaxID=3461400 RepID=UPI004045A752